MTTELLRLHDPRIVSHLSGIAENVDEISTSKPLINASPFVQNSILSPDKSSTIGDEYSHESTNFTRNQDPLDALKNSKGNDINIKEQGIPAVSVKKQAVKTAFEEASKAVRNATTAYEELMQVLPPGMKFDVESTDYVSSNLSVLEELLGVIEIDDASRVMNFQNFSSASTTSNKPIESCSIDMTKEITRKDSKIDSDSIDVNNKNIQLGMQVLIGYDDHVFSECDPNELGNIISTKSQKHEQLKEVKEKMKDANYVHQNDSKSLEPIDNKFTTKIEESKKPSRTVPKTSKNLKVKRYNTRSADGTRKLRVMFDGVQAGNQNSKNDINSKQKKRSSPQKMPINTKETLKNTRSKTSIKMPTIPKGSFGYFFEDYYAKVKVSHPNESLTQVMKDAGVLWREMTESDKQIYRDRQNATRERYKDEMQRYKGKRTHTFQDKPKKSNKKATVVDFSGRPLFKDFDNSSSEETSYMDIELEKKSNNKVVVGSSRNSVRFTPKKEVVREEPIILHHGQRMISQLKNIKKSDSTEPNLVEGSEKRVIHKRRRTII